VVCGGCGGNVAVPAAVAPQPPIPQPAVAERSTPLAPSHVASFDDWEAISSEETRRGLWGNVSFASIPPGAALSHAETKFWHPQRIRWLSTAANGKLLLTLVADEVWVWKFPSGELEHRVRLASPPGTLLTAAASGDLSKLATVENAGRSIRVWDTRTGKLLHTLPRFDRPICRLGFNPGCDRLFTIEGLDEDLCEPEDVVRPANALPWDGQRNVRVMTLWNLENGSSLWASHHLDVPPAGWYIPKTGKELWVGGIDAAIHRWNLETGEYQGGRPIDSVAIADGWFSAAGTKWVLVDARTHVVNVYETATGKRLSQQGKPSERGQFHEVTPTVIGMTIDNRVVVKDWWGMGVFEGDEVHPFFDTGRLPTITSDGRWLVRARGRRVDIYPLTPEEELPRPLVHTALRPIIRRIAPSDPLRVAIHWNSPLISFDRGGGLGFDRVETLRSMTFHITTPDGKKHALKADVTGKNPDSWQDDGTTYLITLDQEGFRSAPRYGDPWIGKWKGTPPRFDSIGDYEISISGTFDANGQRGEEYRSGAVIVTRVQDFVPLTDIREKALSLVRPNVPQERHKDIYDDELFRDPLTPYNISDGANDVRIVRFALHHQNWVKETFDVMVLGDGAPVQVSTTSAFACLAAGTPVETEDGPRPVETLETGTRVWGYDLNAGRKVLCKILAIRQAYNTRTWLVRGGLRLTAEHPVFTQGGWKPTANLAPDDLLLQVDGNIGAAGPIDQVQGSVAVFDITVDGPHNFFAGGILVHNKTVAYPSGHFDPWTQFFNVSAQPAVPRLWISVEQVPRWLPDLAHLSLTKGEVTDDTLQHVGRLVNLRSLSCDECQITDAGLANLGALRRLEQLTLRGSGLRGSGLLHIHPGLRSLDLSGSPLADSKVSPLANLKHLESASFRDTPLGDAALLHLARCERLSSLELSGTNVTDAGLVHLANLERIASLNLSKTAITGAGFVHFSKLTGIVSLDLSDSKVTNEALAHLSGCRQLATLNLAGTEITSAGLKHLATLERLERLDVSRTKVSDTGLQYLKGLRRLNWLELSDSAVTGSGLKDFLPHVFWDRVVIIPTRLGHPQLEWLKRTGPWCELLAHTIEDYRAEEYCAKHIYGPGMVTFHPLWVDALARFSPAFQTSRFDRKYEWANPAPWHVQALRILDRVTRVSCRPSGFKYLQKFKHLSELQLSHQQSAITDAALAQLKQAGPFSFRLLSIAGAHELTDEGLRHIAGFTQLEELDLSSTKIGRAGLVHLRPLAKLKRLKMDYANVDDAALKELIHFKLIEELDVRPRHESGPITDTGVRHLRELPNLRYLHLSGADLTKAGIEALAEIPQLEGLSIGFWSRSGRMEIEHLGALGQSLTLKELYLEGMLPAEEARVRLLLPRITISPPRRR